ADAADAFCAAGSSAARRSTGTEATARRDVAPAASLASGGLLFCRRFYDLRRPTARRDAFRRRFGTAFDARARRGGKRVPGAVVWPFDVFLATARVSKHKIFFLYFFSFVFLSRASRRACKGDRYNGCPVTPVNSRNCLGAISTCTEVDRHALRVFTAFTGAGLKAGTIPFELRA
ncbi:unnamed protein product, partial [Ixodes pacificus]